MKIEFVIAHMVDKKPISTASSVVDMPPETLPSIGDEFHVSWLPRGDWEDPIVRKRRLLFDSKIPSESRWVVYLQTNSSNLINRLAVDLGWLKTGGYSV